MIRRFLLTSLAFLSAVALDLPASAAPKAKATPAPAARTAPAKPAAKPVAKAPARPKKSEPVEAFAVPTEGGVPRISAASAIVVDARSGRVLHEVNADQQRPVASTQKLLTALIVAESGNLDELVTVAAPDTWCEPSMLYIKPGQRYKRSDLLRILLVKSMNDVARCLARDNAGSVEAFALRMNGKAGQLGMNNSHFVNPNGLPAPGQHSTARDMAQVALAAYKNNTLREIVRMKEITWKYPDGRTNTFKNTNRVLRNYALCNGMKTGYTEAAGHCLISSAANGGREVISVVLGDSQQVWPDSYRLLSWGLGDSGVASN